MRIYYFAHLTGRDPGNTGIQRVVRGLGRALLALGNVEVVPVRWSFEHAAVVHAEQIFLDTLAAHNGPVFTAAERQGEPIGAAKPANDGQREWLLIPEAPHLCSNDPRYPWVAIINPLAYARRNGLCSAVVFHDILPLTHPEMVAAEELDRLKFTVYAQALVNAEVILPVSRHTGDLLSRWLANAGYRAESCPRFAPIELPEEIVGCPRRIPDAENLSPPIINIEFVTFGTICARKNQLATLEAFNRLIQRRPELPLTLHVVGHSEPELVSSVARQIRRSGGRAHSHGYLADRELVRLITKSRATIFVSMAEGYGLPVVESLWLGTPCLCSDVGPMAQIGRGGGCLTVDPSSIEAIAAGIQQLATDEAFYQQLLSEIAARKFSTWLDYATALLAELNDGQRDNRAPSPEGLSFSKITEFASPPLANRLAKAAPTSPVPASRPSDVVLGGHESSVFDREFTITAAELCCHDAYLYGENSLRHDDLIEFDANRHAIVNEPVLFYGPYITVEPGIYLFAFAGELDGNLTLRFTHDYGRQVKQVSVDSFDHLVCLALTRNLHKFEVVGLATSALKSMKLHSIRVRHLGPICPSAREPPLPPN
jgi:glycosyltransferase involved in cell wall biosynthesis